MAKRIDVPPDLFKPKQPYEISTPFTNAALVQTERALGVKLPAALVAVLKVSNGGSLRRTTYDIKGKLPRNAPFRDYCVNRLPGVHPTHSDGFINQADLARQWGLAKGLIPLDGDGHWWLCLDYRKCGPKGDPAVMHVEVEIPKEYRVANSVAELLAGLYRSIESMEPAAIALDKPSVRGKRFATILKRLGCKVHRLPGKPKIRIPTWQWPKYSSSIRGLRVWLQIEKNKTYGYASKFDARPAGHPILTLRVHPDEETKCIDELMLALGNGAKLLQGMT
jgi:hypothetical protein